MDVTQVSRLSDAELLQRVERIVQAERRATVVLIAHLAEIEHRGLYLREGYGSMFNYCVQGLHLSEYSAYHRIEAARLAVRFPAVLAALERGDVHLAAVRQLAPILTPENHVELLAAVQHKSKREIAELIAARHPRPAVASSIRKVASGRAVTEPAAGGARGGATASATAATAATTADQGFTTTELKDERRASGHVEAPGEGSSRMDAPAFALAPQGALRKAEVVPLGAQRYKVQFTASAATHEKLRRAQELLRHRIPSGDVAAVIDQALDLLVRDLEKKKFAATDRPRRAETVAGEHQAGTHGPNRSQPQPQPQSQAQAVADANTQGRTPSGGATSGSGSRHVPAHVKREVWQRDQGRCAFIGESGVRCTERAALEFDHIHPFADGGAATADNVRLLCRQHNRYEAQQFFGPWQSECRTA